MRGTRGQLRTVADASTISRNGPCPPIDPVKEVHAIRDANGIAGFVVIDMRGLLRGYVQILCVRADCRRRGLGSTLLRWAGERIFHDSPNVFICVSSFNAGARRLYERVGFELVGTLRELLVPGHDELLLRKTKGRGKPLEHHRPNVTRACRS